MAKLISSEIKDKGRLAELVIEHDDNTVQLNVLYCNLGMSIFLNCPITADNFTFTGLNDSRYATFEANTGISFIDNATWTHEAGDSMMSLFAREKHSNALHINYVDRNYMLVCGDIVITLHLEMSRGVNRRLIIESVTVKNNYFDM